MRFVAAIWLNLLAASCFAIKPECSNLVVADPDARKISSEFLTLPRQIDPSRTFGALVNWIYEDLILKRGAPGFVVGISGTDSILAFLAIAKALEKAGKSDRLAGIHYGEPDNSWFQTELIPWLKQKAPGASVFVDTSLNQPRDGVRWGALMDWSVIADPKSGALRPPHERYWVVGTRNASEEALMTYSNISTAASVQVLTHLWKSEVLSLCSFLGVPKAAIEKSCDVDCACGRRQLPALHIPEVDALLMVRAGQLSPAYVETNIPAELRNQLESFIDEQIGGANFKKQIPYKMDVSVVHVSPIPGMNEITHAKKIIRQGTTYIRPVTRVVPSIIANAQSIVASDLVGTLSPHREAWLPEALTLFNTPGIRSSQRRQMLEKIFSHPSLSLMDAKRLGRISARIGNYGFSFPQWRFLTQQAGDQTSLAEQWGMTRLKRITDLRDPQLFPSDPNRDFWGTGFVKEDEEWYVEYRRAYILVSRQTAARRSTIIIRNNSYYFGRDRLASAVYVSWGQFSPEELKAVSTRELDQSGQFFPLQNMLQKDVLLPIAEKADRISELLDYLDAFNLSMEQWLRSPVGIKKLIGFLKYKSGEVVFGGKPPLYLAAVSGASPSWSPASIMPLTPQLIVGLERSQTLDDLFGSAVSENRFVMMAGEKGDFP